MKKFIVIIILIGSKNNTRSQGLINLFSQSEADISYMSEQIAALQMYLTYTEKGYTIVKNGLTTIGDLKKGEFDLHNNFFQSLRMVNPNIGSDPKVNGIITYELSILSGLKKMATVKKMTSSENSYLQLVCSNLEASCEKSLGLLFELITDNTYQMSDEERLSGIDAIYLDMQEKYAFTQAFTNSANMLAAQRQNEWNEINFLKSLK